MQTAVISLNSVNRSIFVTVKCGAFFAVRTESLNIIYTSCDLEGLNVLREVSVCYTLFTVTESFFFVIICMHVNWDGFAEYVTGIVGACGTRGVQNKENEKL
jgi:hypothetical protein